MNNIQVIEIYIDRVIILGLQFEEFKQNDRKQ